MTPYERVMTALRGEEPDRVPYCELGIDRALAKQIMGWEQAESQQFNLEAQHYNVEEARAIAGHIGMDNLRFVLRAPVYAQKIPGQDGRLFYGDGLIKTEADLDRLELPDPYDDALYAEAEKYVQGKGEYPVWLSTRIGISPTMLSMGVENFSLCLYDNPAFIETIMDRYVDWAVVVVERICQMGFDVLATTDDIAFKTAPFFSPQVFRELVLPRYERIAQKVTIPWIIHSDGNVMPFVEDWVNLGIAGLHPLEKGAMDVGLVKQKYGDQICLLGNVDLNILGIGMPEEVDQEVRDLIRTAGPGGGYIVTSGNSLAGYLRPENVMAMARAVRKYGQYPLNV